MYPYPRQAFPFPFASIGARVPGHQFARVGAVSPQPILGELMRVHANYAQLANTAWNDATALTALVGEMNSRIQLVRTIEGLRGGR